MCVCGGGAKIGEQDGDKEVQRMWDRVSSQEIKAEEGREQNHG